MPVLKSTVCFIGMPGSGKTTMGRMIGEKFKQPFYDLDEMIELHLGMSISEYWKLKGERAFRAIERFYLFSVLKNAPMVLSVGGGTPCFFDNMNLLNKYCFTIYLKMEEPAISNKIREGFHPLFNGDIDFELKWSGILEKREHWYQMARVTQEAHNSEPNVFEAVSKICLTSAIF